MKTEAYLLGCLLAGCLDYILWVSMAFHNVGAKSGALYHLHPYPVIIPAMFKDHKPFKGHVGLKGSNLSPDGSKPQASHAELLEVPQ